MDNFDPYTQNVTFRRTDGTPIDVAMDELDVFMQYNIRICINYASQFGASIVLFLMLLLLTRREKRRSSVFILNSLALLVNSLRLLCKVIHFTTGFEEVYAFFSYDYSDVPPSAYAISILSVVFETILVICIMVSLVIQVYVVCRTLRRRYRHPLLVLSILMALMPIGFRMAWMVENNIYIMKAASMVDILWLESDTNIVITASVCFFCAVFVAKLGYAIRQRHRLGIHDFGPTQMIFICGCQTMTIPALLSILQYCVRVPELSSNVLTLVAISLPVSSLWAATALEPGRMSHGPGRRQNLWQALAFDSGSSAQGLKDSATELTGSTAAQTVCFSDSGANKREYDSDIPLGIAVERGISVNSVHGHSMV